MPFGVGAAEVPFRLMRLVGADVVPGAGVEEREYGESKRLRKGMRRWGRERICASRRVSAKCQKRIMRRFDA